ncbi:MAG: baseplate wedge protein, partial [Minisyncoccia bacterium]
GNTNIRNYSSVSAIIANDTSGSVVGIDTNFGSVLDPGITTSINSRTYYLGQPFVKGVSNPEVKSYSGDLIYIDNRPPITRSKNQKEDIKVIIQF